MFTIQASYKFILLSSLVLCAIAGRASAAEWPDSFQGQPDFDFTRSEVVQELKSKEQELGFVPFVATLEDVMDARNINPFKPKPRYSRNQTDNTATSNPFLPKELAEVEGIELTPDEDTLETTKADSDLLDTDIELKADAVKMNDDHINEFAQYLETTALQKVQQARFVAQQSDIQAAVDRLKLNAISSSPVAYVEINNKRLTPGESFKLEIQTKRSLPDLKAELAGLLPASIETSQKLYQQYQDLLDDVVKKVTADATSEKETKTQVVTAEVARIEKRTVTLTVNGVDYKLTWRGFY